MSDAARYEQVPYPGLAFPQTHPDRLALLAVLHGLDPAPPDAARVLEVGCGDGMNLVAMAAHAPGLSAAGFDLVDPALGRAAAAELGLANVRLEQGDLLDGADRGTFDYVVAHGVYAWVPDPVREALMALIARSLAPHGVAFVSYNALPGARLRTMLREMVLLHAGDADDPAARAERGARAVRLPRPVGGGPPGRVRRRAAERARTAPAAVDRRARPRRPRPALRARLAARRRRARRAATACATSPTPSRPSCGTTAARPAWTRSSTRWPAATASRGSSTPTCSPAAPSARRCSAARARPSTTPSTRRGCAGCGSPPWTALEPEGDAALARLERARPRSLAYGELDAARPGGPVAGVPRRAARAVAGGAAARRRARRAARGEPARPLAGGARAGADQPAPRPRPARRPARPLPRPPVRRHARPRRRSSTRSWPASAPSSR